jgi:DNA invertase Pin-like site-specific DNA recombinase
MTEQKAARSNQKGSDRPAAKLTEADVEQIRQDAANGARQADIADAYGISQSLVSGIVNGTRWRHAPGPIRLTGDQ